VYECNIDVLHYRVTYQHRFMSFTNPLFGLEEKGNMHVWVQAATIFLKNHFI